MTRSKVILFILIRGKFLTYQKSLHFRFLVHLSSAACFTNMVSFSRRIDDTVTDILSPLIFGRISYFGLLSRLLHSSLDNSHRCNALNSSSLLPEPLNLSLRLTFPNL